jgi:hypothetical protein
MRLCQLLLIISFALYGNVAASETVKNRLPFAPFQYQTKDDFLEMQEPFDEKWIYAGSNNPARLARIDQYSASARWGWPLTAKSGNTEYSAKHPYTPAHFTVGMQTPYGHIGASYASKIDMLYTFNDIALTTIDEPLGTGEAIDAEDHYRLHSLGLLYALDLKRHRFVHLPLTVGLEAGINLFDRKQTLDLPDPVELQEEGSALFIRFGLRFDFNESTALEGDFYAAQDIEAEVKINTIPDNFRIPDYRINVIDLTSDAATVYQMPTQYTVKFIHRFNDEWSAFFGGRFETHTTSEASDAVTFGGQLFYVTNHQLNLNASVAYSVYSNENSLYPDLDLLMLGIGAYWQFEAFGLGLKYIDTHLSSETISQTGIFAVKTGYSF